MPRGRRKVILRKAILHTSAFERIVPLDCVPMVSAVVLAAGASTRMGTQKLLLPLGGEPLVRRAVRQVCARGFDDVLVVLGSEHEATLAALEGLPVRHAHQPGVRQRHGQLVPHGGRASGRQRRRHVRARRSAVRDDERVPDACSTPTASTRRPSSASGTARSWRRRICSSGSSSPSSPQLQHGARSVLQRHLERTMVLQFPPDLLVDIDTPEDYELAKSRLSSGR